MQDDDYKTDFAIEIGRIVGPYALDADKNFKILNDGHDGMFSVMFKPGDKILKPEILYQMLKEALNEFVSVWAVRHRYNEDGDLIIDVRLHENL